MWFIVVMHFQMGDFLTIESCNFIKEFVQSCGSFGSCKTKLSVVWLNQHNILIESGVMWLMGVNISINYASVWFFPLGCYIPQSRVCINVIYVIVEAYKFHHSRHQNKNQKGSSNTLFETWIGSTISTRLVIVHPTVSGHLVYTKLSSN